MFAAGRSDNGHSMTPLTQKVRLVSRIGEAGGSAWARGARQRTAVARCLRLAEQVWQLRNIRRNPSCLVPRQQLRSRAPVWLIRIIHVRNLLTVRVSDDVVVRLDFGGPGCGEAPRGHGSRLRVLDLIQCEEPQSSSASRFTAGALGFLTLTQCRERPDR